jgi:hypothetical protein
VRGVFEAAETAGLANNGDVLAHLHSQVPRRAFERLGEFVAPGLVGDKGRDIVVSRNRGRRKGGRCARGGWLSRPGATFVGPVNVVLQFSSFAYRASRDH